MGDKKILTMLLGSPRKGGNSETLADALAAGAALVKEKNRVLGGYVCNGAMSQAMIDRFRANGASGPHSASPANEARWALMKNHPTAAEITLAAERFNERLCLLQTLETQGLEYPAINL